MDRAYYLVLLGSHDSDLITETRLARTESLWLQESLDLRAERLQRIQEDADSQRIAIEKRVAEQEKQARKIGADISRLVAVQRQAAMATGGEPTGQFNTDTVISESNYRDWQSMNVDDIQKFLDEQPGTLKSYKAKDHNGKLVTTAQMIAEASQAWRISPRVILVKLQKEQSLLADKSPSKTQYEWAMGCGARRQRQGLQVRGLREADLVRRDEAPPERRPVASGYQHEDRRQPHPPDQQRDLLAVQVHSALPGHDVFLDAVLALLRGSAVGATTRCAVVGVVGLSHP